MSRIKGLKKKLIELSDEYFEVQINKSSAHNKSHLGMNPVTVKPKKKFPPRARGTARSRVSPAAVFATASSSPPSQFLWGDSLNVITDKAVEDVRARVSGVRKVKLFAPPPNHHLCLPGKPSGSEPQLPASQRPRGNWKDKTYTGSVEEGYTCMLCPKKFANGNTAQQHCMTHFPGEYGCAGCGRLFHHKTGIQRHHKVFCLICPANSDGKHSRATKAHLNQGEHKRAVEAQAERE